MIQITYSKAVKFMSANYIPKAIKTQLVQVLFFLKIACLLYEKVIAKNGLACTLLLKFLVKNDNSSKYFVIILNLEILFKFSVRVLHFTYLLCGKDLKFILKFQFLAKHLLI